MGEIKSVLPMSRLTAKPGITVITPTSFRADFWPHIERVMSRQTVKWDQWVVSHDGTTPYRFTLGQEVVRPISNELPSIFRNLQTATRLARFDKILWVEDDSWIAPDFIERMISGLEGVEMFGLLPVRSYKIRRRRFIERRGGSWTNLWQTAIRAHLLPLILDECQPGRRGEGGIWAADGVSKQIVRDVSPPLQVAFKEVTTGPGLFWYHRHPTVGTPDPELAVLRSWIGDDVELYRPWLGKD